VKKHKTRGDGDAAGNKDGLRETWVSLVLNPAWPKGGLL
jgi:hypothetical protein